MASKQPGNVARHRLLVVEDEPVLRAMLADELRETGFVVLEAGSADEALALLDGDGAPDLVFTDVQMPGSMDGIALMRELASRRPALPVIVTSGNLRGHTLREVPRFLAKPYTMSVAVTLVCETLGVAGRDPR